MTDGPLRRPPLPPGRVVELPGRGTTFVREVAGPPRTRRRSCCCTGGRPPPTSTGSRRSPPSAGGSGCCRWTIAATVAAWRRRAPFRLERLRRRRHGAQATSSASSGASRSATRWAGRSRSWSGTATGTGWTASCCAPPPIAFASTRDERLPLRRHGRAGPRLAADARPAARLASRASTWPAAPGSTTAGRWSRSAAHDWTKILEAGRAIGRFSSRAWVGEIDVPTAVMHHHAGPRRARCAARSACSSPSRAPRPTASTAITTPASINADRFVPDPRQRLHVRRRAGPRGRRRLTAPDVRSGAGATAPPGSPCAGRRRSRPPACVAWRWRRPPTPAAGRSAEPGRPDTGTSAARPSRRARNAELARLGARVGRTYASTAARKLFASAESGRGARPRAGAAHGRATSPPASAR